MLTLMGNMNEKQLLLKVSLEKNALFSFHSW